MFRTDAFPLSKHKDGESISGVLNTLTPEEIEKLFYICEVNEQGKPKWE